MAQKKKSVSDSLTSVWGKNRLLFFLSSLPKNNFQISILFLTKNQAALVQLFLSAPKVRDKLGRKDSSLPTLSSTRVIIPIWDNHVVFDTLLGWSAHHILPHTSGLLEGLAHLFETDLERNGLRAAGRQSDGSPGQPSPGPFLSLLYKWGSLACSQQFLVPSRCKY